MNRTRLFKWGLAIILVAAFSSCSTTKTRLPYFEDITSLTVDGELTNTPYEIKIKPDDELVITVSSAVPSATSPYNVPLSNPATLSDIVSSGQIRQQTYLV